MSFAKMFPLLILIAVLVFGASFLPLILGSVEAGQDDNISQAYKDQINSTRDASLVTMSFSKYLTLFLAVVALVIAVMWINKAKR